MTLEQIADALVKYAEWWGGAHDDECPGDDTCHCSGKLSNDSVTAAVNHLRTCRAEAAERSLAETQQQLSTALGEIAHYQQDITERRAQLTAKDAQLTFADFAAANRERCESPRGFNHRLSSWSASDWMTAVVGEVGEAANVIKKLNRYRDGVPGNKLTADELRSQLRKELGDVFVYLDLLCQSLGFGVQDAAVEVFNAKSVEIGYSAAALAESAPAPMEKGE